MQNKIKLGSGQQSVCRQIPGLLGISAGVTYYPVIFEMRVKITRSREVPFWCAPGVWLGVSLRNVFRNFVSWEEPNLNSIGIPSRCIYPAFHIVEASSKRAVRIAVYRTAYVEGRRG